MLASSFLSVPYVHNLNHSTGDQWKQPAPATAAVTLGSCQSHCSNNGINRVPGTHRTAGTADVAMPVTFQFLYHRQVHHGQAHWSSTSLLPIFRAQLLLHASLCIVSCTVKMPSTTAASSHQSRVQFPTPGASCLVTAFSVRALAYTALYTKGCYRPSSQTLGPFL